MSRHINSDVIATKAVPRPRKKLNINKLPIDGGWGWIVVLGSLFTQMLTMGLGRSYGVIFTELQKRFNSSASITAWVGGLSSALTFILSPLATSLSCRFGTRRVMPLGGLILFICFILSAFIPSTEFMLLSYSVLRAVGTSLVYAPSLVLVSQYFDKYRSIAVSISSAGVGIGSFVYPLLFTFLFDYYGYTGCFIIVGGIMLNLCVCAALHRPVEANLVPFTKETAKGDIKECYQNYELENNTGDVNAGQDHQKQDFALTAKQDEGNLTDLNYVGNENLMGKDIVKEIKKDERMKPVPFKVKDDKTINEVGTQNRCCKNVDRYIDLSLFRRPAFIAYTISMALHIMAVMITLILIPALGRSLGHSKAHSVFLLSIIGISDMISKVLTGIVFDIPVIKPYRKIMYFIAMLIAGSCNFLLGVVESYTALVLICILNGMFNACVYSQKVTMLSAMFGVEKINSSLGMTIGIEGFGLMAGPPIAGFLRDVSGAYTWSFMFSGASGLAGALLFFLSSHHDLWQRCMKPYTTSQ